MEEIGVKNIREIIRRTINQEIRYGDMTFDDRMIMWRFMVENMIAYDMRVILCRLFEENVREEY